MLRDISEIQALATKYSKAQLAHMAQVGMIDPTKAVMAGMMIDRIQKQNMQAPQTTVAQDVLQAPAPMPQGDQQQMPQQMQQQMPQQPQQPGMAGLPSNVGNYAGGGIVAFDEGGDVQDELMYMPEDEIAALDASQVFPTSRGRGAPPKAGVSDKLRKFLENKDKTKPSPARNRAGQIVSDRPAPYVAPTIPAAEISGYMAANKGLNSLLNQQKAPAPAPAPAAETVVRLPVDRRELPPIVSRAAPAPDMPKETVAPAAPPLPAIDTNIPVELTKKPETTTALAEQQKREQHYKEMGINPNMYKDLISAQEEKRKKLPSKDEALGYALMQAGFGLMGARQGQEWQTLGKEAQGALTSYQGALKDIRTSEEKIDEAKQSLLLAENQYKKTGADADLAKVEARQEKIDALTAQDVKAKNEAAIKSKELANHIYGYDRAAAAQELGSLRHLEGTKYHANTMAAAQRWVHQQTPSEIRAVNEVFSRMKELNPNATWLDAWNSRAGQNKTGILSDEDLFRSWDKRFSEGKKLTASKEEKEFAKNYPTWQSYANSMRAQVGGPPPAASDTGGWGKMSVSGQ